MPENTPKTPQTVSPVARTGGGDISERELSRERYTLQTTPPARLQPAHPKKQLLYSVPIGKFTAKTSAASPHVERLKRCLDEYTTPSSTPTKAPIKIGPKAISMEDLTPNKRVRREKRRENLPPLCSPPPLHDTTEDAAAAKICRFMVLSAWRRRRHEVKCLKRTLECQVSCSEKLRIQVSTLKSLLDSDNAKVRLAMRELERLKQLLREKELEKAVLEREKMALEEDVSAAEDRASEMSIGWHNCRNELEGSRAGAAVCEHALSLERAACSEARAQRDLAYARLSLMEEELGQHECLLAEAEAEVAHLNHVVAEKEARLDNAHTQLQLVTEAREACSRECTALSTRVAQAAQETSEVKELVGELRAELVRLDVELRGTREQLDWWPRPLTKLMGAARSWLRYPTSLPEAVLWSLIPARHGC